MNNSKCVRRKLLTALVALGTMATTSLAQPANDLCTAPRVLMMNASLSGNNFNATSDVAGTACASFLDPLDIWFRFTAPSAGEFTFDTLGSSFDTTLAAYQTCVSGLITCNDDEPGGNTWSQMAIPLAAGESALIRLAGLAGDVGTYTIYVENTSTPTGGTCCWGATCFVDLTGGTDCIGTFRQFIPSVVQCNPPANTASPCCKADFNKTGGITVQDVFDFLGAWFGGSRAADLTGNGSQTPTVQSVFDFIGAWFAGGCS